eukprot:scaffold3556_cov190-Cylindrotheca_fusiformis.AAC.15
MLQSKIFFSPLESHACVLTTWKFSIRAGRDLAHSPIHQRVTFIQMSTPLVLAKITRRAAVLGIGSLLLWQNGSASSTSMMARTKQQRVRRLGGRVEDIDTTNAICTSALPEEVGAPSGVTQIVFYYAVESKDPISPEIVQEIDQMLYFAIGDAVLWCTQQKKGARRMSSNKEEYRRVSKFTEEHRQLSSTEARRRLGLISFNSAPSDAILKSESCAHSAKSEECIIVKGRMAIMAHQTDTLDIIIASVFDAIQNAMDYDVLISDDSCTGDEMCSVEKVRWLGTTLDEALSGVIGTGGNNGNGTDDDTDGDTGDGDDSTNGLNEEDDNDDGIPGIAFAVIPLAFLAALAYTLAKRKRRILTAEQLEPDLDYVRVGTGDPPRHFHEGMYHYTRSGATYLSTNCPTCEETRRIGFCFDADQPTIAEGRLYDRRFNASEDKSEVSNDLSTLRKLNLIHPDENNLANKHSSIDVHQCKSSTCRICNYKPNDVAFVSSPRASLSPISSAV